MKIYPQDREKAITETAKQLKGKRIITTRGSEMEQVVLSALEKAGLDVNKDVQITDALPHDGLQLFLDGKGDAYSGDLISRIEASKQGATAILESADLPAPVIDGLVTTKRFPPEISLFTKSFF